jgi:hypothetical protein
MWHQKTKSFILSTLSLLTTQLKCNTLSNIGRLRNAEKYQLKGLKLKLEKQLPKVGNHSIYCSCAIQTVNQD